MMDTMLTTWTGIFDTYTRTHPHVHLDSLDILEKKKAKMQTPIKLFVTMKALFWKIKHIESDHTKIVLSSLFTYEE